MKQALSEQVESMHASNILVETREVFLHSFIGNVDEEPGVEYRMANAFVKNMRFLESMGTDPITVHQHSIGGEWTEGMMVYDAISCCPARVVLVTHGISASMGTIIAQAADRVVTMPNCVWLIHEGSTGIHGGLTWRESKSWAQWEKLIVEQMMRIYVEACRKGEYFSRKSASQIRAHIVKQFDKKVDWILTAAESVEYGFCDAIYENRESL